MQFFSIFQYKIKKKISNDFIVRKKYFTIFLFAAVFYFSCNLNNGKLFIVHFISDKMSDMEVAAKKKRGRPAKSKSPETPNMETDVEDKPSSSKSAQESPSDAGKKRTAKESSVEPRNESEILPKTRRRGGNSPKESSVEPAAGETSSGQKSSASKSRKKADEDKPDDSAMDNQPIRSEKNSPDSPTEEKDAESSDSSEYISPVAFGPVEIITAEEAAKLKKEAKAAERRAQGKDSSSDSDDNSSSVSTELESISSGENFLTETKAVVKRFIEEGSSTSGDSVSDNGSNEAKSSGKRGRGRPKPEPEKEKVATDNVPVGKGESDSGEEIPLKRGRGRPKAPVDDDKKSPTVAAGKSTRGRPK